MADPAQSVFAAFVDLSAGEHQSLLSRSVHHWITSADIDGLVPWLSPPRGFREGLVYAGIETHLSDPTTVVARHSAAQTLLQSQLSSHRAGGLLHALGFKAAVDLWLRTALKSGVDGALLISLQQAIRASDPHLDEWTVERVLTATPPVRFSLAEELAVAHAKRGNITTAQRFTEVARAACDLLSSTPQHVIAIARLARAEGWLFAEASPARAADCVQGALSTLSGVPSPGHLLQEARFRLHCLQLRWLLDAQDLSRGTEAAEQLLEISTNEALAYSLAAEAFVAAGDKAQAVAILLRGASCSVGEQRARTNLRLARFANQNSILDARLLDSVEASPAEAIRSSAATLAKERGRAGILDWVTGSPPRLEGERPKWLDRLQSTELFFNWHSYWTLHEARGPGASFSALGPVVLFEAVDQDVTPWFSSVSFQRSMVGPFRPYLFAAAMCDLRTTRKYLRDATALAGLDGISERASAVVRWVKNAHTFSPVRRGLLARLLTALGFHEDGLALLREPDLLSDWDLETSYENSAYFFLRYISERHAIDGLQEQAYERIPVTDESLRIRFTMAIRGLVGAGRSANIERVAFWRRRLLDLVDSIQSCGGFSEFERALLTSRALRATSFQAFLNREDEVLARETEECERVARSLPVSSERERMFGRENLISVLETSSQVAAYRGDLAGSTETMTKIIEEIDHNDSKGWVQIGNCREREGNLEGAFEAYAEAGRQAFSHGRIGWFRAGRTAEKLDRPNEAAECYLRSFRQWPAGVSPLLRLEVCAIQSGDVFLRDWSLAALGSMKESGKLSPEIVSQIDERLSAGALRRSVAARKWGVRTATRSSSTTTTVSQ